MNKLSRILLVAVIITCLFAGVAAAERVKIADSQSHDPVKEREVHFKLNNNDENKDHKTDDKGECIIEKEEENKPAHYHDKDENNNDKPEEHSCDVSPAPVNGIPEFPTVALPIAAVIGMVFLFQNKNKKE
jgi:ABC-type Zn2+ transport system substrate-binding protein/surface adhesin